MTLRAALVMGMCAIAAICFAKHAPVESGDIYLVGAFLILAMREGRSED